MVIFLASFFSFTVVGSSQPVTIRAEYGPFEASQMVPTQYLVPDLMLEEELLAEKKPALITDFEPHQLDLSAHLVTDEVKCLGLKKKSASLTFSHFIIGAQGQPSVASFVPHQQLPQYWPQCSNLHCPHGLHRRRQEKETTAPYCKSNLLPTARRKGWNLSWPVDLALKLVASFCYTDNYYSTGQKTYF